MTDAFDTYVKTIQLEAFPMDVTKEKPDTLSFQLASYVAAVRHFSSIKALNRRGQGLSLHVGVTTELSGNAFATSDKGRSYIGITFGHFLACSYLSIEVFFRTRAISGIGGMPQAHDPSTLELYLADHFWETQGEAIINGYRSIETNDKTRTKASYFLTYAMTMLAYLHEYYHVMLGHCPVLNRLGLQGRLMEVGGTSVSEVIAKISRAFEIDADRNALILLIKMILSDADLPTSSGVVILGKVDRVRLLLVGSALLAASWFTWQQQTGLPDDLHPQPSVRFKHFFASAKFALQELGRAELFEAAGTQAMDDLVQIAKRCPALHSALFSISKHSLGPGDMNDPVPETVASWLAEEAYRSA